jgi:hypothetical protein
LLNLSTYTPYNVIPAQLAEKRIKKSKSFKKNNKTIIYPLSIFV